MGSEGGRRDAPAAAPAGALAAAPPQPVALLYGPGHRIVHANAAFIAEFGERGTILPIGVPAVEALLDVPPIVLEVVDRVLASGRPLATWVDVRGVRRRLTVAPRSDPETGEVYGVALRLARE
ncbi:MAG TPA: hypothetical protein VGI98_02395 [Candidatus Limnocylindrales bacterium]